MSLPHRLTALLALLALAACGFQPVYRQSPGTLQASDVLQRIAVQTVPGRQGDQLKSALEDHFYHGRAALDARYRLETGVDIVAQPFVIEPDGLASRYSMAFTSAFTLVRISDGQPLKKGTIRRQISYNVSEDDDYATFVAQNDAIKRGIEALAEDYKMRITAILARVAAQP